MQRLFSLKFVIFIILVVIAITVIFLGKTSEQDYMLRLRSRLHSLPDDNFALLKYVICFLVAVSHHQNVNKMSPMALSIVFGPNIFRWVLLV